MSKKDTTKLIYDAIGGEQPITQLEGRVGKAGKKGKQSMIVLSKHFILTLASGKFSKDLSVKNRIHLYEITEILYRDTHVILVFVPPKEKEKALSFVVSDFPNFIKEIRLSREKISPYFRLPLKVEVPSNILLVFDPITPGIGGGIIDVYRAYCAYFRTNESGTLMAFLEDQIAAGTLELDLSLVPGIEPKSDLSFNWTPLLCALRYNSYFRSIKVADLALKGIVELITQILVINRTITKVELSKLSVGNWSGFSEALLRNADHVVQIIDLSHTDFGKRMEGFGQSLASFRHALKVLNLSNCGITNKGATHLFSAFERNWGMSLGLIELDLSGNPLDIIGSKALTSWLMKVRQYAQIQVLKLAGCRLELSPFAVALGNLASLVELDLSENRIDPQSLPLICTAIECSTTLKTLTFAGCKLNGMMVGDVFKSVTQNTRLVDVHLNVSNNDLGDGVEKVCAALEKQKRKFQLLNIGGTSLKGKQLLAILLALAMHENLSTLILDRALEPTFFKSNPGDIIAGAISSLVWSNANLTTLRLRGNMESVIPNLLQALAKNQSLTCLDISENKMPDTAGPLAHFIRDNNHLSALHLGNNSFGLNGWLAIYWAVQKNGTLNTLELSDGEMLKLATSLGEDKGEKLRWVIGQIKATTIANYITNLGRPKATSPSKYNVLTTVEPLAEVPGHLVSIEVQQPVPEERQNDEPSQLGSTTELFDANLPAASLRTSMYVGHTVQKQGSSSSMSPPPQHTPVSPRVDLRAQPNSPPVERSAPQPPPTESKPVQPEPREEAPPPGNMTILSPNQNRYTMAPPQLNFPANSAASPGLATPPATLNNNVNGAPRLPGFTQLGALPTPPSLQIPQSFTLTRSAAATAEAAPQSQPRPMRSEYSEAPSPPSAAPTMPRPARSEYAKAPPPVAARPPRPAERPEESEDAVRPRDAPPAIPARGEEESIIPPPAPPRDEGSESSDSDSDGSGSGSWR